MPIHEPLTIDAVIDNALGLCGKLPKTQNYQLQSRNIRDLRDRLTHGRLRIAVLGQFNRGKSTFINALLGLNVLPVSVLPLTSVPTVISYDEINQCIISFSDGKNDAVTVGNISEITDHLLNYVTEQNNPKNLFCVSEVVVKCNSNLLAHGTVIIDTPGFGSTHTHNTQTTLNLLTSCDASLFLLSADLPITQVEVDFLKNVVNTVPRLFFIFNKRDLLDDNQLKISKKFIIDTLIRNLGFSVGVKLFPVSAKAMEGKRNDPQIFKDCGLAAIEKEIIDFLVREKYFTLSEALTTKFENALDNITTHLKSRHNELMLPITEAKSKVDYFTTFYKETLREKEKASDLSDVELKALFGYVDKLTHKKKDPLQHMYQQKLIQLIRSIPGSRFESVINASLDQLCEEVFARLYLSVVSEVNKPIRNAGIAHIRELTRHVDKVEKALGKIICDEDAHINSISQLEIELSYLWKPESSITFQSPNQTFLGRFSSEEKKYQILLKHYSHQISKNIDTVVQELSISIGKTVQRIFETFISYIKQEYDLLLETIKERKDLEMLVYEEAVESSQTELDMLESLLEGFSQIKDNAELEM